MGNPIFCDCGAVLVEDSSPEGVTPIGGEPIRFRRDTDYVVCTNCHKVYRAKTLLDGGTLSESLVETPAAPADESDDLIAKLERLVDDDD